MKKIQEELNKVTTLLHETTLKWMETEAALRAQETINAISQKYIPDELLDEFEMALPCRQPVWEPES
jgi:hypothetical protein